MQQLREDLDRYETALLEANLNMKTVRRETKCMQQFLAWLDGGFTPAAQEYR